MQEFIPIAEEKDIILGCELDSLDSVAGLLVSQEDFKSLLLNLLSNALKYTSREGTVTVRAEVGDQEELLLSVSDTGAGIVEELA